MKAPRTASRYSRSRANYASLSIDGAVFIPIVPAAERAQVQREAMNRWFQNAIEFNGRPIRVIQETKTRQFYIEEECLRQLETRYVRLPDKSPAGKIHIGETSDETGYLRASHVARLCDVPATRLAGWAHRKMVLPGTAPRLDAVFDPIQRALYISERSAHILAAHCDRQNLKDWIGGK